VTRHEVVISNRLGLHARAAARFVKLAARFRSRVTVARDGRSMDGKSILGILLLAAGQGTLLEIVTEGDDEVEAAESLGELVRSGFGESQ
jgi:phosphocarrier protein